MSEKELFLSPEELNLEFADSAPQEPLPEIEDSPEIPKEASEETLPEESAADRPKKAKFPVWAAVLPGILIIAAVFTSLFYFVLRGPQTEHTDAPTGATTVTEPSEPGPTVPDVELLAAPPADGNAADITAKGTYSAPNGSRAETVVASLDGAVLTNAQLQVYYWQEVYTYLAENPDHGISLAHGLDLQMCTVSETPMTWQQYFLDRALTTWHLYQALALDCYENGCGLDDSYYNYLDSLTDTLAAKASEAGYADAEEMVTRLMGEGVTVEDVIQYVRLYETGHSYFDRVYQESLPSDAEVEAYYLANSEKYEQITGNTVNIRHILLVPDGDTAEDWNACYVTAQTIIYQYNKKKTETQFAQLAFEYSVDLGSNNNGGLYSNVYEGMFMDEINDWCFDSARKEGHVTTLKSDLGYHILYFCQRNDVRNDQMAQDLVAARTAMLVPQALENHPMTIKYHTIQIVPSSAEDSASGAEYAQLLYGLCQAYPDATYERYTTMPVYIQQDYPHVPYGGTTDTVVTHGCGIAALSMLATYMTDTEQSVEEMAATFRKYSSKKGTSWTLFDEAPMYLGFYTSGRTKTWEEAYEALEAGKIVVTLQHTGFFTRGGHYLVLYELKEDGRIMIRDSNVLNFTDRFKDTDYYENGFPAEMFIPANAICWVIEPKVTQVASCTRCGDPEAEIAILSGSYTCPRCVTALHLRKVYDTACDIDLIGQIQPPVLDDSVEIPDIQPVTPPPPEDDEEDTFTPPLDETQPEDNGESDTPPDDGGGNDTPPENTGGNDTPPDDGGDDGSDPPPADTPPSDSDPDA